VTTWKSLAEAVLMDLGRSTADSRITWAKLLTYLSEAQHELQNRTNAVKCFKSVTIGANVDGIYNLPCSIRTCDLTEYRQNDSDIWTPILQVPFEAYQRQIYTSSNVNWNGISNGNRDAPPNYPPYPGVICAIFNNKLYVYPVNTTGTIRLRVIPYLPAYTPDDYTDWASYGRDPGAMMGVEGPETVFTQGFLGMKAYCKYMLAESFPNELSVYGRLIPGWKDDWDKASRHITTVDVQRNRRTPSGLGVLQ